VNEHHQRRQTRQEIPVRTRTIALALSLLTLGGICGGAASMHAAAANATANPFAEHSGQGPVRRFISGQVGRLITLRSELNLSDDQKAKMKAIVASHRQEIAAVAKPLLEHKRAIRDAMLAKDGTDEAGIRAATDAMAKSLGDAAVLGAKIRAEARGVLTPEQMKKIGEFRTQLDTGVDGLIGEMSAEPK
jgi:Spy/CpxP family protein refolding chaperone